MKILSLCNVTCVVLCFFHITISSASFMSKVSHTLSGINVDACVRPAAQFVSRHVPATLLATAAVVGATAIAFPAVRRCILDGLLSFAWRQRSLSVVRFCCLNLNRPDAQNRTLLCRAAETGDLEMVKALLKAGVDPDFREPVSHKAAIHYAVERGNTNIVDALALGKANLSLAKPSATNLPLLPMGLAIEKKDLNMVRCLLDKGVGSNASCTFYSETMPLAKAVREGATDIVRLLIERGANVNYRDQGEPLLYMAARSPYTCKNGLIGLLLEAGAQIPAENECLAFYNDFTLQREQVMRVVSYLPKAIHRAVIADDIIQVGLLAAANEDLNEEKYVKMGMDEFSATPLFIAVKKKNGVMYKALLEVAQNPQKMIKTALDLAVRMKDVESVRFLVEQGVTSTVSHES